MPDSIVDESANPVIDARDEMLRLLVNLTPTSKTKKIPEWWTVSGYEAILLDAYKRLKKHHVRAVRVYADRAPSFEEALRMARELPR